MSKVVHTRTHGMSKTRIYKTWGAMRERCENPHNKSFHRYGARGIFVCERWRRFENFYADMGDCPPGLSIERIDNDGPYSPENCRWATKSEQASNRRSNHIVEYQGRAMSVRDWASELGLIYGTLLNRLRRGRPLEEALSAKLDPRGGQQSRGYPSRPRANRRSSALGT